MFNKELTVYSLRKLKRRKVRSFLTILSILIGITTIFIFVSFGWGLFDYINKLTSESSADKLIIQSKGMSAPGLDTAFKLTDKDLTAIQRASGVFSASGAYTKVVEIMQGTIKKYSFMISYDPSNSIMLEMMGVKIDKGRLLVSSDNAVVLGYNYQLKDKIFSKPYSVNDEIEINGEKLKIVGFFSPVGNPQDDAQIYVTNQYMKKNYNSSDLSYGMIIAKADVTRISAVVANVEQNLRKSRGLEKGKEDFFVQSFDSLVKTYTSALDIVIGFIILIAFISVFVSAVNTANTMITSVLERIREIGVMKAIGATNFEIMAIFLFESSFLGFLGGIIGVFFGFIFSFVGGTILASLGWGFLSPHFSLSLFLGCIIFATLTGAISGVVPAINASKTNVVDALRYE